MPTAQSFFKLGRSAQLAGLRRASVKALAGYDLEVLRLRLLAYGRNTTFRVDTTDGRQFALRINVNSRSDPACTRAEVAWLAAIARDTSILVACPQLRARDRSSIAYIELAGSAEPRPAVLFSWLTGRHLQHALCAATVAQLGSVAATLHQQAAGWSLPADATLPCARTVLLNSPPVLWGEASVTHPNIGEELRALLRAAWECGESALRDLWSQSSIPPRPLHFDLHPSNLKWQRQRGTGRLGVFDFDSSVFGHPVQDLAVILHHLRRSPSWTPAWDKALREGYERHGSPTGVAWPDAQVLENLIAARSVLLVNDVVQFGHATASAELRGLFVNAFAQLRAWRQSIG